MFGNYVFEKSSAQYEDKILLIDEDCLETITNYSVDFAAHGFEIVHYKDDLSFRIEYEEKVRSTENRIVVIAKSGSYVPYDIRHRLQAYSVSFTKLFPKLDAQTLKEEPVLDLDLLCLAYGDNFEELQKRNQTEQFLREKVYVQATVKRYVELLYQEIMELVAVAKSYKDWFTIAEKKAKIDVLAIKYTLPVNTDKINQHFKEYVLTQFGKLSSNMDRETPVVVSKAMEYMRDNSDKFAVIVMDGMSEFDWNIISSSFRNINYSKESMFAMIPTTTSVSRQCLLSNKYPSQLLEPWKQSKEKAEFIACAKELGFADNQIEYARGYEATFGSFIKCGAVIINDVDDMVHGQMQGRIGMYNDITVLVNQAKLLELTKRLLASGFDIYITADHGNTPCRGLGKLMGTGVEIETKSRRMVVLKDFADKDALMSKYGLIDYPKYYLSKDYDYLICNVGDSFDTKDSDVMTHGGISLDEVVVPFIKVKAVQTNG